MSSTKTQSSQKLVRFDWAMKNILRNKANFDILEGFLTSLLGEKVVVNEFWDNEHRNIIECVTSENIPKIISVNVVYSSPMSRKNKDYIYSSNVNLVGRHNKCPFPRKMMFPEYYIIYVENFNNEIREYIDEWMYFFKNEAIEKKFHAPGIKEAEEKLNYLAMSKEEQDEYDHYIEILRHEEGVLDTAVSEAENRGKAEGRAEGETIGEQRGELKGKLKTAAQMLSDGVPIENISKWTNLSTDEIHALKNRKN